jgi:hypothetical protein
MELKQVELFSSDYVFLENGTGNFMAFSDGQILITADEEEVKRETDEFYTPVRCIDLDEDKQRELKENILKFENNKK